MNTFEMVVLIVLISVVAGVVNNYIKNRGSMTGHGAEEFEARLGQLNSLEERVRTLEKIVTDRNFELREKFRDL
ncbi:MAG: hypothetical protein E4H01_16295 [Lysobacterales bacterium]|nr:MAG: hypothetical protein E4H01_16295 [Xanthomonadales bacterium]